MIGNPMRNQIGGYGTDGSGFNAYAAGRKVYGGGRSNPTFGMVDRAGYQARDNKAALRRDAILRRAGGQGQVK